MLFRQLLAFFLAYFIAQSGLQGIEFRDELFCQFFFLFLVVEIEIHAVSAGDGGRSVLEPLVGGRFPSAAGDLAESAFSFDGLGIIHLRHGRVGKINQGTFAAHALADAVGQLYGLQKPLLAHQPVVARTLEAVELGRQHRQGRGEQSPLIYLSDPPMAQIDYPRPSKLKAPSARSPPRLENGRESFDTGSTPIPALTALFCISTTKSKEQAKKLVAKLDALHFAR